MGRLRKVPMICSKLSNIKGHDQYSCMGVSGFWLGILGVAAFDKHPYNCIAALSISIEGDATYLRGFLDWAKLALPSGSGPP